MKQYEADNRSASAHTPVIDTLAPILARWSPRAMSGEALTKPEIQALFDAARRAPSANNNQPWRFVYARSGSLAWAELFELLTQSNQSWSQRAALLIVVLSCTRDPISGKPTPSHSFDTGAAWQNLALQGHAMGLVVHAMRGFDMELARKSLHVSDDLAIEAIVAVGRPGSVHELPERYREKERPSGRLAVQEVAFEDRLPPLFCAAPSTSNSHK